MSVSGKLEASNKSTHRHSGASSDFSRSRDRVKVAESQVRCGGGKELSNTMEGYHPPERSGVCVLLAAEQASEGAVEDGEGGSNKRMVNHGIGSSHHYVPIIDS